MTLSPREEVIAPNEFIVRTTDGANPILQRVKDGYINATALCRASGRLLADYLRLGSTTAYFSALEADMGIPITELVQVRRGGNPQEQGTWVHPHIAIHLAQWASADFAVQVSKWVYEWMRGELVEKPTAAESPFQLIMRQAQAGLELEQRQMVLDRRQTAIEAWKDDAEDRLVELEAKIKLVEGGPGYFAITGYANIKGIPMPGSLATTLGREASKMCRENGIPTGTVMHELHGTVKTYPEEVLSIIFFKNDLLNSA